ncbi:MAG TPA: hypothetical protein PKX27_03385 [Bacteroidales bacterium]|jgi:hypothetical protein|nr:hypothetical protein [Bacteroidales bacterium]HOX74135.1 hypothetical protein [Bacteroidales bacterium]HPM87000.1 hypothetical protein [Bacteroidales bacterium]HQM68334.1 hypothetical protein [Bacteroidales bacterium]
MKKIQIIMALLTVCLAVSFGQTSESITMKKVFGGYQFYQGDKRLNMNQLVNAIKPNEQAYKEIRSAKTTYAITSVFAGAGGFMVGYPIGTAIGGGDPNWTMAGIGAGLIVVSIPLSVKFNKQARQAVNTYNNGSVTGSFWNKSEFKFCFTANGMGLKLRF